MIKQNQPPKHSVILVTSTAEPQKSPWKGGIYSTALWAISNVSRAWTKGCVWRGREQGNSWVHAFSTFMCWAADSPGLETRSVWKTLKVRYVKYQFNMPCKTRNLISLQGKERNKHTKQSKDLKRHSAKEHIQMINAWKHFQPGNVSQPLQPTHTHPYAEHLLKGARKPPKDLSETKKPNKTPTTIHTRTYTLMLPSTLFTTASKGH